MADKEKKEKKAKVPKREPSEVAKARSKKLIVNLLLVTAVMTIIGIGLTSIGLVYVMILLSIGMLPGIVANIVDGRPGRFASKTVIAFNLSGISPHMAAIFSSGSPNQTASSILIDPNTWILVYGFAAFGWGIVFLIPHITYLYLEITANYTVKKLTYFQEKLVDEWGSEIKTLSGRRKR